LSGSIARSKTADERRVVADGQPIVPRVCCQRRANAFLSYRVIRGERKAFDVTDRVPLFRGSASSYSAERLVPMTPSGETRPGRGADACAGVGHQRARARSFSPGEMNAAVIAAIPKPLDTTNRRTIMPFVTTTTAATFVVLGAARDSAVRMNDERAGARHALTLRGR
jgi:hypothetical protein